MSTSHERPRRTIWAACGAASLAIALVGVGVAPANAQEPGEVIHHASDEYDCYSRLEKRTGTDTWTGVPEYRVTLLCSYIAEGWEVRGVVDAADQFDIPSPWLRGYSPREGHWFTAQSDWVLYAGGVRGTKIEAREE